MNSEIFLDWFRYAVSKVGVGYFGYAERVYCYELYHFMRVAMFHFERENGRIHDIYLHSELVKTVLSNVEANRYEVWPLQAQRMPDFLFHTPGNFDNQVAAIEVKTTPHLLAAALVEDLSKLTELRNNYRYELGIFHCVNVDLDRLKLLLNRADSDGAGLDPNIRIECKPAYGVELQSTTLGALIT